MLSRLTPENKNKLLIVVMIVTGLLIYRLAITRTLEAHRLSSETAGQLELAINAPEQVRQLQAEIDKLDFQLSKSKEQSAERDQALLEMIAPYCEKNQLVLLEFPKSEKHEDALLEMESNRIVVQGSFSSLQGFVYTLEQQAQLGKIISLNYRLKKESKTKKMMLVAELYIERAHRKNN